MPTVFNALDRAVGRTGGGAGGTLLLRRRLVRSVVVEEEDHRRADHGDGARNGVRNVDQKVNGVNGVQDGAVHQHAVHFGGVQQCAGCGLIQTGD